MEYFNWVFIAISLTVDLASLMPYADTLPHGEGLQSMQHREYNWHNEQGIQGSPDHQKNVLELWHRERGENEHRDENWLNGEQAENWHLRQENPQLPDKETTAQRADLQNKRSELERLQRWQIEQQFEKEKYISQEDMVKQDKTQKQEKWQEQKQKERKYEQQKQENLNWQQRQAIPFDTRRQNTRWQNTPQLHQVQAQPTIPHGGAHKYYYPADEQLTYYHQQGELPRAYQAPALHPEIYHNTREYPFPPRYPEFETDKNAFAKNQQIIYDKEDGSKVQINHNIPKTPGTKLIPLPFPHNVADVTHIGSQRINEQQKLTNSNIQQLKKQNKKGSDADAIVENWYQQDIKPTHESQVRPQLKAKQSLIDEQITKARIEYERSSEPEPVNDQSRLITESNVKYNNLNQIQKNREYRLLNRQLQLQPNKVELDRNEPNKEPKEAPSIIFKSPIDILNDKQQIIIPQEQENRTQQTPPTDSNDQNEERRKLVPQKTESNDQVADEKNDTTQPINYRRNRRRRRQKPSEREENSKQTETAIEKLTVGEDTTPVNPPADKIKSTDDQSNSVKSTKNMQSESSNIFGKTAITKVNEELNDNFLENNNEQDETAPKEKSQSENESEPLNNDTKDRDDHKNDYDSKENDDHKIKKAPDDDNSINGDEPSDDDDDSKVNEDQKTKKALDEDDDFKDFENQKTKKALNDEEDDSIDGDERNDDDDDSKHNEDQNTKKVIDDDENDSVVKDESEITVKGTTKTEQNGQDKEFIPPNDKDDITTATFAPDQPIEMVWYSIIDYYYGDDSLENKTIKNDTNQDEIPTIDIVNILAAEIINSLIPSNYANIFNFIRIVATNAMRGRDGLKNIIKEPVIKGYVSQITEKIIPLYLKIKTFVEPHAFEEDVDDVVIVQRAR